MLDQQVKTVQQGQTTLNSGKDALDARISQIERTIPFIGNPKNFIKLHTIDSNSRKVKTMTV